MKSDLSLLAFRQFNEVSCGVSALRYMFSILIWPYVEKPINYMPTEEVLKTKYETGTEPEDIEKYLQSLNIKYRIYEGYDIKNVPKPAMVLYQWGGEGHYGVVVESKRTVKIFNPYNAKIDRYTFYEFNKRWHDKPQIKWALTILGVSK